MNRRTFTASLAGLLGVVGIAGKAKAEPKPTKPAGRTLNVRGPVTLTAEAGQFDTVNIYPGGTLDIRDGYIPTFDTIAIRPGASVGVRLPSRPA